MSLSSTAFDELKDLKYTLAKQQPILVFLSIEDRLKKLEDRNIKFNLVSKEDANDFITKNTYLYKISHYKDNFYTNNKREFIDLDFGYLKDLSTIDMHIRYTFLKLCLDIEHGIKTTILAYFNKKNPTNGYSIVDRYIQSKHDKKNNTSSLKDIKLQILEYAKLATHHLNQVYIDIQEDIRKELNIWELIECVAVNELIEFYIFFKKAEIDKITNKPYESILYAFRHVRNICAHNSPFLIKLDKHARGQNTILKELLKNEKPKIDITNQKILDIASLCYLHKEFVTSQGIRENRKDELKQLLERVNKNSEFYHQSYAKKILIQFNNLVDIFFD